MKYLFLFITTCLLSSCFVHNVPNSQTPLRFESPNIFKIYVDQNGTFYPDEWKVTFGNPPKKKHFIKNSAYSLLALANTPEKKELLKKTEEKKLNELEKKFKTKSRIFILVHGFNNDDKTASSNFNLIRKKIDFDTQKDLFIDFYWDGLVSNNPFGSGKIWLNTAGYSQLAGEFGLRKILNRIFNKDVIIISHSRGASVVLSSFSTPTYNPKFSSDTYQYHNVRTGSASPLKENNNRITSLMLAPAIGALDFYSPDKIQNENKFRIFSKQILKIHHTINTGDKILKKFFKKLSGKVNPTNLGYDVSVTKSLSQNYPYLEFTDYNNQNFHGATEYISHEKFISILKKLGIKTR